MTLVIYIAEKVAFISLCSAAYGAHSILTGCAYGKVYLPRQCQCLNSTIVRRRRDRWARGTRREECTQQEGASLESRQLWSSVSAGKGTECVEKTIDGSRGGRKDHILPGSPKTQLFPGHFIILFYKIRKSSIPVSCYHVHFGVGGTHKMKSSALEKGMATYSSIPAWRIPWTEEPGRLWPIGLPRVAHN